MDKDESYLASLGERVGRGLASRFSRRSFLGQMGAGSVALAVGSGGAAVLSASHAEAALLSCPCANCGHSVTCEQLNGSNSCPGDTCECGWWTVCAAPCSSSGYRKVWTDCCGGCDGKGPCASGWPFCYYQKAWGCGCNAGRIKCRKWHCSGPPGVACSANC